MIDLAIKHEIYLQLYNEWGPGRYKSEAGIVLIKDMHTNHIVNAINHLTNRRNHRKALLEMIEDSSDYMTEIKNAYSVNADVLALKILELQNELDSRDL